jgi:hypothetical protein
MAAKGRSKTGCGFAVLNDWIPAFAGTTNRMTSAAGPKPGTNK